MTNKHQRTTITKSWLHGHSNTQRFDKDTRLLIIRGTLSSSLSLRNFRSDLVYVWVETDGAHGARRSVVVSSWLAKLTSLAESVLFSAL